MASLFKVTLVFEAASRGWTESYIYSSSGDAHGPVEGPTVRLCKARALLLGDGGFIKAYRISKEGTGPDALLRYKRFESPAFDVPLANGQLRAGPRAQPNVALLVKCADSTESKRKNIFLRGIPDHIEVEGGQFVDNIAYKNFFAAFRRELINEPWGWLGVTTKFGPVDLLNYESTVNGIITFTLQANLFEAGTFGKRIIARFKGVNGKSQLNGPQIVKPTDAQSGKLVLPLSLLAYKNGGQVSYSNYAHQKIETVEILKVVTRKAGAPLLESRGRARAKPRL